MTFLQAVLVGFLYYFSDAPFYFGEGYYVLQRPIVAGFLVGLVMGDPVTGTIIGATINLMYLGHLNVGGSMPSDMALAGYIGTAIALATNVDTEVALAIAVPLGLLGTIWWVGRMTICAIFVHWADRFAEKANIRGVMMTNWAPAQVILFVFKMIVTIAILFAGVELVGNFLVAFENTGLIHAFSVIGGLLPALGIGLNLRAILKKQTVPFLMIGFLLVTYFQISLVGVALFGAAAALIFLFYTSKGEDQDGIKTA